MFCASFAERKEERRRRKLIPSVSIVSSQVSCLGPNNTVTVPVITESCPRISSREMLVLIIVKIK